MPGVVVNVTGLIYDPKGRRGAAAGYRAVNGKPIFVFKGVT